VSAALVALKAQPRNWASEITQAWQKTVESIFAVGDLLIDAKTEMGSEAFWSMVEAHKLPFGRRTAERLIVIAKDERLRATHGSLPASWRTLYEPTRLPEEQFKAAIKDRRIYPDVDRRDAEALVDPPPWRSRPRRLRRSIAYRRQRRPTSKPRRQDGQCLLLMVTSISEPIRKRPRRARSAGPWSTASSGP